MTRPHLVHVFASYFDWLSGLSVPETRVYDIYIHQAGPQR